MNVAMLYGAFSSACHGPFNPAELSTARALTGSESSFFNLALTLAERGHGVIIFCDCPGEYEHPTGAQFFPLSQIGRLALVSEIDAVVSWNEPDMLKYAPRNVRKIVAQQLNDWPYCREPGWQSMPDVYVFPSDSSLRHHREDRVLMSGVTAQTKMAVVPNSVDLSRFSGVYQRNPRRAVWASSPDRGLHHLLRMWPRVRSLVPDAELRIFYRLEGWLNSHINSPGELGNRAREVAQRLLDLHGNGVTVCGPVNSIRMAQELQQAGVLPYPCDPVSYTEGFGCSVLDACAAGCQPIIHAVDALAEVHGSASIVLNTLDEQTWAAAIAGQMLNPYPIKDNMREHAARHDRAKIADEWERIIQPRSYLAVAPKRFNVAEVITKTAAHGGQFRIARITGTSDADHASWWSFDDEQELRDRFWKPGKGDVVLDIGAAFGSYALPALAQGARLVAFNPCEFDAALMGLNLSLNPDLERRCLMVPDGLYSETGWFDPDRCQFSAGDVMPTDGHQWLRVTKLDDFLDARPGIPDVTWLKIDVEGAELEVLRGAEKCLRMYRPRILVENHEFFKAGISGQVRQYLESLNLGYHCAGPFQHCAVSHSFYEVA